MPFHAQFDLQGIVASLKSTTSPKQFGLKIGSWDNFTLETFGNLRFKNFDPLLKALPDNKRQEFIYLQRAWSNKIPPGTAKKLIKEYKKLNNDPAHFKIPKATIISYISNYKDQDHRLTFKFGCTDANSGLSIFLHVMGVNGKPDAPDYLECLTNTDNATTVNAQNLKDGNFSVKTGNYFTTRAGSVCYKQGIAHIITSTSTEWGVADFLDEKINPNSKGKDMLYIFPAHGEVKRPIKPGELLENQNTLVLTFFDSAAGLTNDTAKSDLLYDLGGACCPPQ